MMSGTTTGTSGDRISARWLAVIPLGYGVLTLCSRYFLSSASPSRNLKNGFHESRSDYSSGSRSRSHYNSNDNDTTNTSTKDNHKKRRGKTPEELTREAVSIHLGLAGGAGVTALAVLGAYPYCTVDRIFVDSMDRLRFTLGWEACTLLPLLSSLSHSGYKRYVQRRDKDPKKIADHKTYAKLVRHHVEQTALALPLHIMLSSYLSDRQLHLIPLLVSLWLTGQISYTHAYLSAEDEDARTSAGAFGYSMAMTSSGVALCVSLGFFIRNLLAD